MAWAWARSYRQNSMHYFFEKDTETIIMRPNIGQFTARHAIPKPGRAWWGSSPSRRALVTLWPFQSTSPCADAPFSEQQGWRDQNCSSLSGTYWPASGFVARLTTTLSNTMRLCHLSLKIVVRFSSFNNKPGDMFTWLHGSASQSLDEEQCHCRKISCTSGVWRPSGASDGSIAGYFTYFHG